MSNNDEIEKPSGIQVKVSKYGSPRIAQLLQKTVFGTEGKLRYRQQDIAERIRNQSNVQFIEILKGKRVLGTVGMANRAVTHGSDFMRTLYVRYLSVAQPFKPKKRTSFQNPSKVREKKGTLRELITNEITSHFEQPFIDNDRDGAFYAYVESANINSRNLCLSMGFRPTRKVETLLFSRFNPSQKRSIQNLSEYEQDEVKEELQEFYKDYSFYFEDNIFQTGFYQVKKEKGEILGGIRAVPVNWQLVDYPGFEGWLMRDVLPYLPLTNKLFQPDSFKFLAFDYAWHKPGLEHVIPELMSHCCSIFGINMGMIWGDMQSSLIKNLKSGNELGFIHSVVGSVYADLMVRPINYAKVEEEIEEEGDQEIIDDELEFPPQGVETAEIIDEQDDDTISDESSAESIEEENETKSSESDENEDKYDNENVESESTLESEPEPQEEKTPEVKKDELEGLREVLKRPIFVSALDMT
jgi:hypothetical protein